uniref:Uncharacterized protein n=1 Tax=Lepeophtheirus salmonis TaxID=72036 RepID=A0A0K2VJP7_LEPSM
MDLLGVLLNTAFTCLVEKVGFLPAPGECLRSRPGSKRLETL